MTRLCPLLLARRICRYQIRGQATAPYADEFETARRLEESQKFEDADYELEIREQILNAALPHVHEKGWSKDAIAMGAEEIGYPKTLHGLFPSGGVELALHFYDQCNGRLAEKLGEESNNKKSDRLEFFQYSVETRLRMNTEYVNRWHEAIALFALPQNYPSSLKRLTTLTDDILYHAGDRSSDISWYGKRVGLGGVYKATELFMLQDKSQDYKDTWQFLNRRLADGKRLSELTQEMAKTGDYLDSAFTTVRNMMGMRHRT